MSDYEFWKELGKIFNAVVSYQEKSIEFNKRFINPWIRIGNVFDQQDHQREEVRAYKQATEIDPDNAQNWIDLGNALYRNQSYDEAVCALQKAIELDPNLGWSYSNLALIYAEQDKHVEAKALYQKSIDLLTEDRDKAVVWNRLGNLYRKLNEYELAIHAFQIADELDSENTGFKDVLGEKYVKLDRQEGEPAQNDTIATSIQLIVKQNQSDDEINASPESDPGQPVNKPEPVDLASSARGEPGSKSEDHFPGNAIVQESPSDDVSQVEEIEEEMPDKTLVSPVLNETITSDTVAHITETFTDDVMLDQTAETKTAYTETILAANTVNALKPPEPFVEAVEPVAESETGGPVEELGEASDLVEPTVEVAESVSHAEVDKAMAEPADVSKPLVPVVETVEPLTSIGANDAVVEPAEISKLVESVDEASEDLSSIGVDEEVAEPTEVSNLVPPVIEVVEPVASAISEEHIEETITASDTVEPATEAIESDAPAVMEEMVAELTGTLIPIDPAVQAVEPAAPPALEESAIEIGNAKNAPQTNSEGLPIDAGIDQIQNDSALGISSVEVVPTLTNARELGGAQHPAYDAFLQSEEQMLASSPGHASTDMPEQESPDVQRKAIALVNESGDFQLEVDAKNAHVWNELGNVYFNRGTVEDAIVAYSKAIELDRLFAWPYSNLALAYVQKGRFAEAMLLYQRSIELFTVDKDKAISWNRLGNVYRRLNDYDNAITAYQRADELDPDNSTIYLQSRFSLLGSFQMEQNTNVTQ